MNVNKLTLIQNKLKVPKSNSSPGLKYKFRNCDNIFEAVKPLLNENNCTLVVTDELLDRNGLLFVRATVEFIDNDAKEAIQTSAVAAIDVNTKNMNIAQSCGSSSSYARKYALSGMFLLDDTIDPDSIDHSKKKATNVRTQQPIPKTNIYATKIRSMYVNLGDDQQQAIKAAVKRACGDYGVEKLEDMSEAQALELYNNLKELLQ